MKKFMEQFSIFLLFSCFSGFISPAQDCYWADQAGGILSDGGDRIAIDSEGNTYVAGDTQSDYCYFHTDTLRAGENNSLFIVKYNADGQELWVKKIGGGNIYPGYKVSFGGMKYDSVSDCLLINGTFFNHAYFGSTLLAGSELTVFTIKMNPDGVILWARAVGGEGEDRAFDITSDEEGNVYISGSNQNEATFDNITIPAGGFLAKYDASGNLIWAKNKFRSKSNNSYFTEAAPINLMILGQNLFVNGGTYNTTIVVDSISVVNFLSSVSNFLASFNKQGDVQWLHLVGQTSGWCGTQMSSDEMGNLNITGLFREIGIFETDTLRNTLAYGDCFLAKYTVGGELVWVRQLNSTSEALGFGVATDNNGGVYLSGFFGGSATFGNQILTSGSNSDMYVTRFSSFGDCLGVRQYSEGIIRNLSMDQSNNLYFTGEFNNSLILISDTIISRGEWDLFVAKCSEITDVEELKYDPKNQLLIYANPNTGKCNITIPEEFNNEKRLTLQIFDIKGKLIQQTTVEITDGKIKLNIQAQAKGMYTAILSNGKKSYSGKIVFE